MYILLFFLLSFGTANASCLDDITEILKTSGFSNTVEALNYLSTQDSALVNGTRLPTWSDLAATSNALAKVRADKKIAIASQKIDFYISELKKAAQIIKTNARPVKKSSGDWTPEIAAPVLYWDYVYNLNKELPKELRIPLKIPARSQRHLALKQEAKDVLKSQERYFEKSFSISSGFKDWSTFRTSLLSVSEKDSNLRKNLTTIDKEEFEFAMARASDSRWWIQRTGFQNIHSGSSGLKESRNNLEATLLGQSVEQYKNLSPELKPKYGYLHPTITKGQKLKRMGAYGDDYFVFDKEKIREYVTFTFDDSMNAYSKDVSRNYSEAKTTNYYEINFMPWSRKSALAPFLDRATLTIDKERTMTSFGLQRRPGDGHPYVELQIWGPLDLSHVKKFVFSKEPPSGEFLDELMSRNIEIWDGRTQELSKWSHQ